MIIDGHSYTLLKDYDRGKYKYLTFTGKTTYLRERVNLIVIRPCERANKRALKTDLGLIVVTGICAAISAAGTFLNGGRASGQDRRCFTDFVSRYMDPFLQQNQSCHPNRSWVNWLYGDVRCGLSHSFTIDTGGIEYQVPLRSYAVVGPHGPEMNPRRLLKDLSQGFSKYLNDVTTNGPAKGLGTFFEKRFDEIFHD